MTENRNFRSAYLEKVGIKGVEEKKSLEILLKEQPLDTSKLIQFCLRFPVPSSYRPFLWKIILGVLPSHRLSHEFVMKQRCQQYEDLEEALICMGKVTNTTALPLRHLKMFLIEEGCLPFEENKLLSDPDNKIFMDISCSLCEIIEESVAAYWLTTKFYKCQQRCRDVNILIQKTQYYTKREDAKLDEHLQSLQLYRLLPLEHWFKSCFAQTLPLNTLERIWDKLIGGSVMISVFVAVALFLTFKRPILCMKNSEEVSKYLSQIPEDSGDIIASKAIELWQKNGSPLMVTSLKSESPASGVVT